MAVNKVVYGDETLLDLTNDSVTPDTLAEGATAHDASGARITGTMKGGGGEAVQSDWNQTDDTAADFIKNKPFGEMPVVIMEEQEIVYDAEQGACIGAISDIIQAGDTVFVVFDGENYECEAVDLDVICFGNLALLGFEENTGEPFACMAVGNALVLMPEEPKNHTVKMTNTVSVRIPDKYATLTKLYANSAIDTYLYTDMQCTARATIDDIPDHCDFCIGDCDQGFVATWHTPLLVYSRVIAGLMGYGTVVIIDNNGDQATFYTAEYTPET